MIDEQNQVDNVSGVSFDHVEGGGSHSAKTPNMVLFMMNHSRGRIKDAKQATTVLWFLVFIMLALSAFLVFGTN
jgi:hypothetical protein